ncbi:recombinase zinc beta ribbon domain-containing protein [Streptomyces sp. NPDC001270]|uniref:recombinase zinc beta ribbon domain-containing protein n=1 Tax=Streptomyces sp. NPDC001270 TaxID=3364554 RepID=UPI00369DDEAB
MSEAERHLIRQRMWSGCLNKARRGELAFPLPSGYVRRPSRQLAFDPDEQVQSVIRLLFAQFERLGTLHGVLRYPVENDSRLGIRLREEPDKGTLEWRRPNRMTLQTLLHNPAYAGIYAYGRRRVDPRRQHPARPGTGRVARSRGGWHVMIPNVLPAYITIAQFEANEAKLTADRARAEAMGAVRGGPAPAAGLVHCGRCNRRMTVRYHTQHSKALSEYVCARDVTNYGPDKSCQLLNSACVDAFVEHQALAALTPAAVEVSLHAADQVLSERSELERLWPQRLERAAQEANRALPQSPPCRTGEPPGRAPPGDGVGGGTRRPATTTGGVRPLRSHQSARPYCGRAADHHGSGRRHRGFVAREQHHDDRPQGDRPRGRRQGHRYRARHQRAGEGRDHLSRRDHHGGRGHSSGPTTGTAQILSSVDRSDS